LYTHEHYQLTRGKGIFLTRICLHGLIITVAKARQRAIPEYDALAFAKNKFGIIVAHHHDRFVGWEAKP
jgi:hypothetical protein